MAAITEMEAFADRSYRGEKQFASSSSSSKKKSGKERKAPAGEEGGGGGGGGGGERVEEEEEDEVAMGILSITTSRDSPDEDSLGNDN
ncbi:hypothetical protein HZH68_009092 [Vespula germanica]|uniref:Uncharacterized protein n=1 Tax=Vespula germanica TaxID=30212 RepID=A0A834K155_VESGE|nr:hypothetical protein HZH68_009092 [Vespula germanica]